MQGQNDPPRVFADVKISLALAVPHLPSLGANCLDLFVKAPEEQERHPV